MLSQACITPERTASGDTLVRTTVVSWPSTTGISTRPPSSSTTVNASPPARPPYLRVLRVDAGADDLARRRSAPRSWSSPRSLVDVDHLARPPRRRRRSTPRSRRCGRPGRRRSSRGPRRASAPAGRAGSRTATTIVDVVARTSHEIRRCIRPACRVDQADTDPAHARAGSAARPRTRPACAAATTGGRRRTARTRRTPAARRRRAARACVTTSPGRDARASSRSNSLRASSSGLAREGGGARALVDDQLPDPHRLGGRPRVAAGTPQHRADPGRHLVGPERLDHVVVGAAVEGLDHGRVVVAGGDHDDRHLRGGPDHRDQREAGHVGQAEVEQHHLRMVGQHLLEAGHAGARAGDGVPPLGEAPAYGAADRLVVLDHEDAGHARTVRRPAPRGLHVAPVGMMRA